MGCIQIHSLLVSHVATNIKSLALIAVPSTEGRARNVDDEKQSVAVSRDSIAHPPSGHESTDNASLPFES
ncbi:unnamed protein product [Fusarium graminearum]|uniref:Uncharacterized protein n=1 Tax=Gibberella zeae TaxID=5518 RepID=A0A9N8RJP9_GIBZA|nr:unnamed protein product [Fusarium graminearum]